MIKKKKTTVELHFDSLQEHRDYVKAYEKKGFKILHIGAEDDWYFTAEKIENLQDEINKHLVVEYKDRGMDVPKELFKFDLEAHIRKTMPELLMETEGLNEEEAKEETEKMIKTSKEMTKFCKRELENIKCDFVGKVDGSIDTIIQPLTNEKPKEGVIGWIETTKEEALEAFKKGNNILVVYVDGTHSLLRINKLYPRKDIKSIAKIPERRDRFTNIIEIENVYVWKG